jgi:hypothetical protein
MEMSGQLHDLPTLSPGITPLRFQSKITAGEEFKAHNNYLIFGFEMKLLIQQF